MVRRRILASVCIMALGLSACGAGDGDNDATAARHEGLSHLDQPIDTVQSAEFDVAEFDGQPLLLWFWAPWCVICRHEGPHMAEFASSLDQEGSSVVILGVAGRGSLDDMANFVEDTGTQNMTHLADIEGKLWESYGVISQPAYAFITPQGQVETVNGTLSIEQLRQRAADLEQE